MKYTTNVCLPVSEVPPQQQGNKTAPRDAALVGGPQVRTPTHQIKLHQEENYLTDKREQTERRLMWFQTFGLLSTNIV